MKNHILSLCIIALTATNTLQSQITVTDGISAQQLVSNELVGPGINIISVQYSDNRYTNSGTFSGVSNLGFNEGIILATGNIDVCIGPNNQQSAASGNVFVGDEDLDNICGTNTVDAMYLQMDFFPMTDSIEVTIIFGSEEYPEYACANWNDVFAIFLSGPNPDSIAPYNMTNIARIPGTSLPIAINTVHNGSMGVMGTDTLCDSLDYTSMYVDNTGGTTIQYDGFTIPITIRAHVSTDSLYRIKFAIADAYDEHFDSGLFIKKKSFTCVGAYESVNENDGVHKLNIIPNPANDNFRIVSNQPLEALYLISVEGKTVQSFKQNVPEYINIQQLPAGYYIVKTSSERGFTTCPLIVTH